MSFDFTPEGAVDVPDIPYEESLTLPAERTAVVVVDMQNDFVKPEGSLFVDAAAKTLPAISDLLDRARTAGTHVAFTQDTHYEGDPEWNVWPEHCRVDTWGWKIVDELEPRGDERVFRKNRYDGFYGTDLEHALSRVWRVDNLVVVGTVANICVAHTAGSAGLRWFNLAVPADGVSALTPFDQAMLLRQVSFLYNGKALKRAADIDFRKN